MMTSDYFTLNGEIDKLKGENLQLRSALVTARNRLDDLEGRLNRSDDNTIQVLNEMKNTMSAFLDRIIEQRNDLDVLNDRVGRIEMKLMDMGLKG